MPAPIVIAQSDIANYIQATLLGNMKKGVAYKAFIDPLVTDVYSAIRRLENRDDYHEMMQGILDTDTNAAKRSMMRVKNKYLKMTEKALDTAAELLDEANQDGKTSADKAQAVRLANETFGAMAIIGVADPTNPGAQQGTIDRRSAIL